MNNLDFLKAMGGANIDKEMLGLKTDQYIDRILKLMQIIYYATQSGNEEVALKVQKVYQPVIEILADHIDDEVKEYQAKNGEL